jgi:hypothetical protein
MKHLAFAAAGVIAALLTLPARADVPTGYTGVPFSGTPYPLPGRIDLANYDKGPLNVAFYTTHHGDETTSAPNYRTDTPQASIYVTCQIACPAQFNDKPDDYTAGPLAGTAYPGGGIQDYYIGAVRPGDWVNVTVNVLTTGMYALSSTVASAAGDNQVDIRIFDNDLTRSKPIAEAIMPATGDYHNWVPYSSTTDPDAGVVTIPLQAGVQVLTVQSGDEHWNMDYLQFSLVLPDGGLDNGGDASAGASGGGSDAASEANAASGSSGATATSGSAATSGVTQSGSSQSGSVAASAGTTASGGSTSSGESNPSSGTVSGSAGVASGNGAASSGGSTGGGAAGAASETTGASHGRGCSVGASQPRSGGGLAAGLLLAGALLARAGKRRSV